MLQFPLLIPFPVSILISTGGTLFSIFIFFPSEPSDTHASLPLLAQPYAFPPELSI